MDQEISAVRKPEKGQIAKFSMANGAAIFLFVMIIFNSLFTPNFFNINTLWNIIIQSITIALVAMGMTFVISSGGIDISVGSIMAIAGMITASLLPVMGPAPSFLLGALAGLIFGAFNGFIISVFKIQPIIVTLAVMIAGRGIAKVIGSGNILTIRDDGFMSIAMARFGGIPVQLIYMVVIVGIFFFISKKTVFARYIEALGDNFKASVLSGIRVNKLIIMVYGISGLMAALSGLLTAARTGAADPARLGSLMETYAIAAVAIGDTPMSGGKAKIIGTLIGAVIMQLITITFNMNNIPYDWSLIAETAIIIVAVYIQNIKRKTAV